MTPPRHSYDPSVYTERDCESCGTPTDGEALTEVDGFEMCDDCAAAFALPSRPSDFFPTAAEILAPFKDPSK